jgi:hypothetical protein
MTGLPWNKHHQTFHLNPIWETNLMLIHPNPDPKLCWLKVKHFPTVMTPEHIKLLLIMKKYIFLIACVAWACTTTVKYVELRN